MPPHPEFFQFLDIMINWFFCISAAIFKEQCRKGKKNTRQIAKNN